MTHEPDLPEPIPDDEVWELYSVAVAEGLHSPVELEDELRPAVLITVKTSEHGKRVVLSVTPNMADGLADGLRESARQARERWATPPPNE